LAAIASVIGLGAGCALAWMSAPCYRATVAIAGPAVIADSSVSKAVATTRAIERKQLAAPIAILPAGWRICLPASNSSDALQAVRRVLSTTDTELRIDARDPAFAVEFANALAAEWDQSVRAQEAALRQRLAKQAAPSLSAQQARLSDAELALDDYLKPFKYSAAVKIPAEAEIRIAELRSRIDSERRALHDLESRAAEADLRASLDFSRYRIISPAATASQQPTLRFWFPVWGLLAGLLLGFVAAFIEDFAASTVRAPGESPGFTDAPELGVIPSSQSSPFWEESFRQVLASLWLASTGQKRPRCVVITSPGTREGKSTVACQLAITLAATNRRVLLIDAHLRSPQLHKFFSLDNDYGLADVLNEPTEVEEYFFSQLAQDTGVDGLYLLPAGTLPGNAAALGNLDRLRDLLVRFRLEFHAVLIDAPPTLVSTEARLLARLSDGVIQVHRAGKTRRDDALESVCRLQGDGSTLFGTVLNGSATPPRL
jgi:capsular exopolysaccharide synthesis family protein